MTRREEAIQSVCDSCGAEALRVQSQMAEYVEGDIRVSYPEEMMVCDECHDSYFTRDQMECRSKAITSAIRESQGLFTPERITRARVGLGMKPAQFERALGLGKKTVSRWERGTVPPSRAANFALWVAERYPRVVEEFAAELSGETAIHERALLASVLRTDSKPTAGRGYLKLLTPERGTGSVLATTGTAESGTTFLFGGQTTHEA